MDVDECISTYINLQGVIFGKGVRKMPIDFLGNLRARYNDATLAAAIMEVLKQHGFDKDEPLQAPSNDSAITYETFHHLAPSSF